jgi:hypothetical protein
MLTDLRTERSEACLSDLGFDEWHAGELDPDTENRASEHVTSCERCRIRKARLDAQRAQFIERSPSAPARKENVAPRRLGVVIRAFAGAALSAAALVALFIAFSPGSREQGDRVKGSHRLGFFVRRGEDTLEGMPGQRVFPGDQLRFVVTMREAAHVAVLSRDGAGKASVYFPTTGTHAQRLAESAARPLDGAIELDDTLGRERILGVFCPESFELEPLRRALEAQAELRPPAGCALDELDVTKAGQP